MLSDPLVVTYDGNAKSLPRGHAHRAGPIRVLGKSSYVGYDEEFAVYTQRAQLGGDVTRSEIILERVTPDPDDPFTGNYLRLPNRVGLVFEVNNFRYATETDVPLLRAALDSLVTSTIASRLISGEL